MAAEKGKATRLDIHCQESVEKHGENPSHRQILEAGLDYVSCSPFHWLIARLAAAQAIIEQISRCYSL